MKLLLTGSRGMLGKAIVESAKKQNITIGVLNYKESFLMPEKELIEYISNFDYLIHSAANTNVEECEKNPDVCYKDNYLLTDILASACNKAKKRFIFISSTGVYGSEKQDPYREYDYARPTTHHHLSKFLAEQRVLQLNHQNLVVRTGWLFGGSEENPKNFIAQRLDEAELKLKTTGILYSNESQRGVPCYVLDIAMRILLLIERKSVGIFNCVNSGNASRFEYVKGIIEFSKINISVEPISSKAFNRIARVSNNEMANNWKMECLGFSPMPSWNESLGDYIANILSKREVDDGKG